MLIQRYLKYVSKAGKMKSSLLKKPSQIPDITPNQKRDKSDNVNDKKVTKRPSIERIYQKKTQLEHILLRPDTYIGSIEPTTQQMWVWDGNEGLINREITYVPGLFKIFDEILVNAADNKIRDKTMNCIKINIDIETNTISIWNNGKGIPVTEHKTEKIYIPAMIFGHLLTSSNFDDAEKKVVGGRNGYGAKLCNIFSKKFTIETACRDYNKKFKQTWSDNMSSTSDPKISDFSGTDFTCVTFQPDLSKFKMVNLDKDITDLFSKRAYDIAASTWGGVKVYLNDKRLAISNFKDYIDLYTKGIVDENDEAIKLAYEKIGDRWEIAVTNSDKGFQSISFVNSICTVKGGRHVDYITDQVVDKLMDVVKKKNKAGVKVKPFQIKNHLWVFVNCLIENPTFDSQTKENMTLQSKSFGSKCTVSEKFLGVLLKTGIVENIMNWIQYKAQSQLNTKCHAKKHSKLKGIPKLDDANDAGTKNSLDCTLILTEGDSAKTLAISGLGVVGRDRFGIFPLKGKLLNVREATHKQLMENVEINNMIRIIGLQYKKQYNSLEDLKTLRYGKIMIMADQDQDGSHIKGLIINFIHYNWPSLVKQSFLDQFITPIVKAFKGKDEKSFFSIPEFEEWKNQTPNWHLWKVKYYKGLGTSTAKEAKEYFNNMPVHRIKFKYQGNDDDDSILLAFSKKRIEDRKDWLRNWMEIRKSRRLQQLPEFFLYGRQTSVLSYADFINKELILFSNMDNERSIPSLCDGLKPGQRKVLFTCFKRNDKREVKVAQLAGSVGELSAYHHGEASLMGTIINLAQDFVGSNNVNLLLPIGQFGTRLHGGKDAASPRYIFTYLNPLTRAIFPAFDEPLLKYMKDDNIRIEPEWYIPIVPMVLINGAEGIGTGWSTKVPNYDLKDIIKNLRVMIEASITLPFGNISDLPTTHMVPSYKGFRGSILEVDSERIATFGEISVLSQNVMDDEIEFMDRGDYESNNKEVVELEISELPIKKWTQDYKESVLEGLLNGSEKITPVILDYKEYNTDTTVKFVIKISKEKFRDAQKEGLHKFFKLQNTISTSSMVLFDANGVINRYNSPLDILKDFFWVRLDFYKKRKVYLDGLLTAEAMKLDFQARFILEKIRGDIVIENVKRNELIKTLISRGYESDPVKTWKVNVSKEDLEVENTDEVGTEKGNIDFDYLLGMALWSLTKERVEDLIQKQKAKNTELQLLRSQTEQTLWVQDLDNLMQEMAKMETKELEESRDEKPAKAALGKSKVARKINSKNRSDTLPSIRGTRVIPAIDEALKIKVEKAKETKEKRKATLSNKTPDTANDKNDIVLIDEEEDDSSIQSPPKKAKVESENEIKKANIETNEIKKANIETNEIKKVNIEANKIKKPILDNRKGVKSHQIMTNGEKSAKPTIHKKEKKTVVSIPNFLSSSEGDDDEFKVEHIDYENDKSDKQNGGSPLPLRARLGRACIPKKFNFSESDEDD
ncbi:DNA topoisomerase 2-alpha-like isoform X2 [Gordionus sp. m RMFG-2023]|uniref:DNA topoisomerase 2-alpha-like isoform X2 n=1 Tax=Gordionus sp. m RMFG-2023 TaxID=3053472 RepID=UPI0031FDAE53